MVKQLTPALLYLFLLLEPVAAANAGQPVKLGLGQVLQAAAQKARADQARLQLVRRNAEYLETQNRVRVDIRPSLGLLAFSNPLLLAGNLVSSVAIGKRGAPSQASMQSAWFDVLTAELNAERARTRGQMEAARAFYTLLEKQELVAQASLGREAAGRDSGDVEVMLTAARITALEKLAMEQRQLEAELAVVEAESARRAAAMDLAVLIGQPEIAELVQVHDEVSTEETLKLAPVSDERVFERAFQHRADARMLRDRIASLRVRAGGAGALRGVKPQSVNVGYGYVAGVPGGVSRSAENFLLGGNTGRVDLNFGLSLRDTGEKQALVALAQARAELLETELRLLEEELRREVFAVNNAIAAAAERVRIARQRLLLAQNGAAMTAARVSGGLAEAQAQMGSRLAVQQAQAEVVRAESLRKANYLALLVLCGLHDQPGALRLQALQ